MSRVIFLGKLCNDVLVDLGINVPAQHVQNPPISHRNFLRDRLNGLFGNHSVPGMHETWTESWEEDDRGSEDNDDGTEDGHNNEPEPEEDVRLLVHNVEGEDANGVVLLNCC